MMSFQEKLAMGFSVRFPSSQTSSAMRWAAWSMRRPVMRMSLLHSLRARWKGSTLLTKSKSALSISSASPYCATNSSRVATLLGNFHNACLEYFCSTSLAHSSASGKRCKVSMATSDMPSRTSGKCFRMSATKTLSVANHAVAKTTLWPSLGKCFSMSLRKASTFDWSAEELKPTRLVARLRKIALAAVRLAKGSAGRRNIVLLNLLPPTGCRSTATCPVYGPKF
mmetsp:Transcript_98381/g.261394  ORF Transcript_98381/g.261394 Transcript_98381/m.261394 type:complete len:225 (+) Transcript_98381:1532-2206(+)